eukprot:2508279-Pyramimonas_sp.AAC.1
MHLGACSNGMTDWWTALKSRDGGRDLWRRNSFLRGRAPEQLKWCVPLQLFDDAGPFSDNASADT